MQNCRGTNRYKTVLGDREMLKKAKVAFLLVIALVFAVQGIAPARAEVINKLTVDYIFDGLGDALNYGVVAETFTQNNHAETSVYVDKLIKLHPDPFLNTLTTYMYGQAYPLYATVSAPDGESLKDMQFALFTHNGSSLTMVEDTVYTVEEDTNVTAVGWKLPDDSPYLFKNLYVRQVEENADGSYSVVDEGEDNSAELEVHYGPTVSSAAPSSSYIGEVISNQASDSINFYNVKDHNPPIEFGPGARLVVWVTDPYNWYSGHWEDVTECDYPYSYQWGWNTYYTTQAYLQYKNEAGEYVYAKFDGINYEWNPNTQKGAFYADLASGKMYMDITSTEESNKAAALLEKCRAFSEELGNLEGGKIIHDESKGSYGSYDPSIWGNSTVTGPIDDDGNVVSLYTVKLGSDWDFDEGDLKDQLGQQKLLIAPNEYVVFNLVCDSKDGTVIMHPNAENMYITAAGKAEQALWGDEDSGASDRVLFNFVYLDEETGTYKPFEGTVKPTNSHGGTLLAPSADILVDRNPPNGALIGKTVTNNGKEIHQRTMTNPGQTTWVNMLGDEDVETGAIKLVKVKGTSLTALGGAKFGLYSDKAFTTKIAEKNSDPKGVILFEDLEPGTYYVKELKAPPGYELSDVVYTVEVHAGVTSLVGTKGYVENTKGKGGLEITKVESGNTSKKLEGAVFEIYSQDGPKFEENKAVLVDTYTTNASGMISVILDAGEYWVKEIEAPFGYYNSFETPTKIVVESGKTVCVETVAGSGVVTNEKKPTGTLATTKVDSENTSTLLSGAEFAVYTDSECTSEVAKFTTGNDGVGSVELPIGTYYVKETKAPSGYELDSESVYTVTITEDATTTFGTDGQVTNDREKGSVYVRKITAEKNQWNQWDSNTVQVLEGAEFTVYNNSACGEAHIVATAVTDSEGYARFALVPGQYWIKETKAPRGYAISNSSAKEFWLNAGDDKRIDGDFYVYNGNQGYNGSFSNTKLSNNEVGRLTMYKVDENGAGLNGAKFQLFLDEECTVLAYPDVFETQTYGSQGTDTGKLQVDNLPLGTYYIKEVEAPEGYELNETVFTAVVTAKGNQNTPSKAYGPNGETALKNEKKAAAATGSLALKKTDADTGAPISDVVFTVYSDEACNTSVGLMMEKDATNNPGVYTLENLPAGTYYVKETTAPTGYVLSETVYTVTVQAGKIVDVATNGVITDAANATAITNATEKTSVAVTKVWANVAQDAPLPSIQVQLHNGTSTVGDAVTLPATDGSWSYTWENLPKYVEGTDTEIVYTVDEVTVPTGYVKEVAENGTGFTITNTYVDAVEVNLSAQKTLDGTAYTGSQFTFQLKEGNTVKEEVTSVTDGAVAFTTISYGLADMVDADGNIAPSKTFTYTISEVEGSTAGVTYSTDVYTAVVTLTYDADSKALNAKVEYKQDGTLITDEVPVFKNTSIEVVEISVTKNWVGAENDPNGAPSSIQVQLYAGAQPVEDPATLYAATNWTYTWPPQPKYDDKGAEIFYEVDEVELDGYVSKLEDCDRTGGNFSYTITNTYIETTQKLELTIPVSKAIVGGDINTITNAADKTFEFALAQVSDPPGPLPEDDDVKASVTGEGDVTDTFGKIVIPYELLKHHVGGSTGSHEYSWLVSETKGSNENIIYDDYVYRYWVTVTVDENGVMQFADREVYNLETNEITTGKITIEKYRPNGNNYGNFQNDYELVDTVVADVNDRVTFINTYFAPTEVELSAKKTLNGADYSGDEYTFLLKEGETEKDSVSTVSGGVVTFDKLSYTLADLKDAQGNVVSPKTFTYTISEVQGSDAKVTYDSTVYTAEVTVTCDVATGTLNSSVVYKKDGAEYNGTPLFANRKEVEKTSVSISKQWTNEPENFTGRPTNLELTLYSYTTDPANAQEVTGFTPVVTGKDTAAWTYTWSELPAEDEDGNALTYIVKEETVPDGYAAIYPMDENGQKLTYVPNGSILVNKYVYEEYSFGFMKYLDGQPSTKEFEFTLTVDSEDVDNAAVGGIIENDPTGCITVGPMIYGKNDLGKTYEYTLKENAKIGYSHDTAEYVIAVAIAQELNVYGDLQIEINFTKNGETVTLDKLQFANTTETVSVSVTKVWNDNNNAAGKRPANIQVQLKKDGAAGDPVTLPYEGEWSYTWENLPKYDEGETEPIDYTVVEVIGDWAEDYVPGEPVETENGFTITNTYVSAKKEITLTKKLNGQAPGDVEFDFTLTPKTEGDKNQAATVKNSATGGIVFGLKYGKADMGKTYVYEIAETPKAGYYCDSTVYTVTVAVGANIDADGNLPLTVTYKKGDKGIAEADLVFENASAITADLPVQKTLTTNNMADVEKTYRFTLTPTYDGATEQAKTIDVAVDGTASPLTGSNKFELSFAAPGTYTYTVAETVASKLPGYTYDEKVYTVTYEVELKDGKLQLAAGYPQITLNGTAADKLAFTNEYEQEAGSATLHVKKVFTNGDLSATQFTFQLLDKDGKLVDEKTNDANGIVTFDKLTYTEAEDYTYTIVEVMPEGATAENNYTVNGMTYDPTEHTVTVEVERDAAVLSATVTYDGSTELPVFANTYAAQGEVELAVEKAISGRDFMEGDSFTFTLAAKPGEGQTVPMPAEGGETVTIGYADAEKVKPFGKISYTEADVGETYTYTITETKGSLPGMTYDETAHEVTVTITDNGDGTLTVTPNYGANKTAVTVTNTYANETTDIAVTKVWVEANDEQQEQRPDSVDVQLYADNVAVDGKTLTLNAGNSWTGSFTELVKYVEGTDTEIQYTVEEITEGESWTAYYTPGQAEGSMAEGYTITNTSKHVAKTEIAVTKVWVEANDEQQTLRPDSVDVQLYADGVAVTDKVLTLNEGNQWTGKFTDLVKYRSDNTTPIAYTVKEITEGKSWTEHYTTGAPAGNMADGYTITNTSKHVAKTEIAVTKVWVEANDEQQAQRPESIDVQLYADNVAVDGKTLTLTATDGWTGGFANLQKYVTGTATPIVYTVKEVTEDADWLTSYTPGAPAGNMADGYTITNTSKHVATTEIAVTKVWVEANDEQQTLRPDSVDVQLYADGVAVTDEVLTLNEGNQWTGKFADLVKYQSDNTTPIAYTVKEITEGESWTEHYTPGAPAGDMANGYTITNTSKDVATTEIAVTKAWVETNAAQQALRPASVDVQLYADGVAVDGKVLTLTATDAWTGKFTDLVKYQSDNVTPIAYTVKEVTEGASWLAYYTPGAPVGDMANGFTITNTNTYDANGKLLLTGTKEVTGDSTVAEHKNAFTFGVFDASGTEVANGTNDASGNIAFREIAYTLDRVGTHEYTVKETTTAVATEVSDEYIVELDETEYTILVSVVNNTATGNLDVTWEIKEPANATKLKFENKFQLREGNIGVVKVDSKDTTKGLAGAEFTVYTDAACTTILVLDGEEAIITTGETGAGVLDDLPIGTYWVKETKAPQHYLLDDETVYEVTVVEGDRAMVNEANGAHVTNRKMAKLALEKSDRLNPDKKLPDAEYTLFTEEECENILELPDGTPAIITTGEDGVGELEGVPAGTYWVKETKAPEGYEVDPEPYKVVVPEEDDPQNPVFVQVSDFPLRGALSLSKTVVASSEVTDTFLFDIELTLETGDPIVGSYKATLNGAATDDVTFAATETGAKATVELKDGETLTIIGLRSGVSYTVTEQLSSRYDVTVNGAEATAATGTITDNGHSIVKYQNTLKETGFTVEKVWLGEDAGEIKLTLYANGVAMDPQPEVTRDGNTYSYENLVMKDENGEEIVYTVKETAMAGYTTTYQNAAPNADRTDAAYNGGKIINQAMTTFAVKKEWSGLAQGEKAPAIQLTLYCNGKVYTAATPTPDKDGWYTYADLPAYVDGEVAVYTVKEQPVTGFTTTYINKGENAAVTDCAYNGSTIVNSKIPQTGDNTPLTLWMLTTLLAACGLMGVMATLRKREN